MMGRPIPGGFDVHPWNEVKLLLWLRVSTWMSRNGEAGVMQRWSSSEIASRERIAFWVDVVCRTLVRLRCEPTSDQRFFGEIDYDELGPLKLVSVRSVAQRVSRTAGLEVGCPAGFFHVNIMRTGRGLMDQDGRQAKVAPGGFVFSDSSQPYAIDFIDNFSAGVLRIPRWMLLQRIGAPECFTALRVGRTGGLGALVASMLGQLPTLLPTIPKTVHERVADNIVDLIAVALLSTGEGAPLSAQLTLTRVKFWIETHLAKRLSGEEIASHCGLSLRHLNRLFEGEGTSVMHYVWERRLVHCWRDLSDPAQRHRSISEIALANGFNNPSHFSRVFHARFGLPARAARREGISYNA
jgi:AraC-like DNA-binding protein